jgi:hypothetical protein
VGYLKYLDTEEKRGIEEIERDVLFLYLQSH